MQAGLQGYRPARSGVEARALLRNRRGKGIQAPAAAIGPAKQFSCFLRYDRDAVHSLARTTTTHTGLLNLRITSIIAPIRLIKSQPHP